MCGIYGIVAAAGRPIRCPEILERMGTALRHRGPDDRGTLVEPGVAFGAERLRIVDPTPAGNQPFTDADARVWLVCNGEIYNADALRARYRTYPYRSRTDVETILPLYRDKGVAGLADLEGMFALALFDFRHGRLILARDPAGEKPLLYARTGREIWFASEMQGLLHPSGPPRALDREAARDFLTLGYVREPRTMFSDVRQVEAGTAWTCCVRALDEERVYRYAGDPETPAAEPRAWRRGELQDLLRCAVAKQAVTGGAVGVFTSGGVDSGLLAALAVEAVGRDGVRLFTAGFDHPSFDESAPARLVARHLGAHHVVVPADEASLRSALTAIVERVAEPLGDPAILPTYLLARAARQHVRVVLSGEGADELFGGYPTYLGHRVAAWYGKLPGPLRKEFQRAVQRLPVSERKVSLEYLLKRFAAEAGAPAPQRHVAWIGTGLPRHAFSPPDGPPDVTAQFPPGDDPVARATLFDYRTYLRDNLLVKVDRATMLCSLESRAPYLDPAVVRFAHGLDARRKVRGLTTKWALKQAARGVLPRRIVHRRKRGLSVPVAQWLNNGLRAEADRLLAPDRLDRHGLLRGETVWQLLSEHRSHRANHARALWPILMFEHWMERWGPEEST